MTKEEIIEGNKLIATWLGWHTEYSNHSKLPNVLNAYIGIDDNNWALSITVGEGFSNETKEKAEEYLWNHLCDITCGRCGTFHKDWNKLMPVVEKIESLTFNDEWSVNVQIELDVCIIHHEDNNHSVFNRIETFKEGKKIESVWLAVVEFIKWYNQNKK